ncbi:MAG: Biosynthetic arginine decarboxylase [Candidatus Heimdallarchaeota archaeon LC_3]|nr:MAG: Biosynthetic arginine decarboxylase [Candidatus Heimdallarchaeota archaeon LC_3]
MKTRTHNNSSDWSFDKSRYTYGIGNQASEFNYLDINEKGNLILNLTNGSISFSEITEQIKNYGISSFVLRIPELIENQLEKLYHAFEKAIEKNQYPNYYQGVFPVKVNQTFSAINSIRKFGNKNNHGFEVGTKPELLLAVSNLDHINDTLIICNGTKDQDYLEATMILQRYGFNIIISIESLKELNLLIDVAKNTEIIPNIGLRIKLLQEVPGHWGRSSGLYSKFGFSGGNLNEIIDLLLSNNLEIAVKLIHGHIGSQISDKAFFRRAASELIGTYVNLWKQGFKGLEYLNLGGGLGIDYVGNQENGDSGTSYSFNNYAETIVSTVKQVLTKFPDILNPIIVTESGRAISAHYEFFLLELIEKRNFSFYNKKNIGFNISNQKLNKLWNEFKKSVNNITSIELLSNLNDLFEESIDNILNEQDFWLSSNVRSEIEYIKTNIGVCIRESFKKLCINNKSDILANSLLKSIPNLFKHLVTPTTQLLGNFSVFNGICDAILVDQYFPLLPISHLNEKPSTLVKIVDITCDSDGEISKYVTPNRKGKYEEWKIEDYFTKDNHIFRIIEDSCRIQGIPLPESCLKAGEFLVIGLTGAYQSTVYFDQNLLGRVPEISLSYDETSNKYKISLMRQAEYSADLLPKMGHNPSNILEKLPSHSIFEKLLYSSPYITTNKNEKDLFNLFINQENNTLFSEIKEELLFDIIGENINPE